MHLCSSSLSLSAALDVRRAKNPSHLYVKLHVLFHVCLILLLKVKPSSPDAIFQ